MNFTCTALPEITWLLTTRYIQRHYLPVSFQYGVKKETVLKQFCTKCYRTTVLLTSIHSFRHETVYLSSKETWTKKVSILSLSFHFQRGGPVENFIYQIICVACEGIDHNGVTHI